MELDWMMLANHAESPPNGLIYISGGAWDSINVSEPLEDPPDDAVAFVHGVLVIRLLFHVTECDIEHPFRLAILDEDGEEIGGVDGSIAAVRQEDSPPGWPEAANVIVSLTGLPLPRFGLYSINLRINNEHKGERAFRVVRAY